MVGRNLYNLVWRVRMILAEVEITRNWEKYNKKTIVNGGRGCRGQRCEMEDKDEGHGCLRQRAGKKMEVRGSWRRR